MDFLKRALHETLVILTEAAKDKQPVEYNQLVTRLKEKGVLYMSNNKRPILDENVSELAGHLSIICDRVYKPMISSILLRKDSLVPGKGFYLLMVELKKILNVNLTDINNNPVLMKLWLKEYSDTMNEMDWSQVFEIIESEY